MADYLATLYVAPRVARFSDAEKGRHVEASVCKSRGGSALLQGARSPGRWDPACSCGWRNSSNEDKRAAVQDWREHRSAAVFEERRLANGDPIFRVVEAHDAKFSDLFAEWRGFESANDARKRRGDLHRPDVSYGGRHARVERSFDGETWEAMH